MTYTTGTVSNLLGITRETVRQWSRRFDQYLSAGANPSKGAYRTFNADDMSVFAYIHKSKQIGISEDEIAAGLAAGQRAEIDVNPNAVLPASEKKEFQALQRQITDLQQRLIDADKRHVEDQALVSLLKEQLEAAQLKIDKLNQQIGRLSDD